MLSYTSICCCTSGLRRMLLKLIQFLTHWDGIVFLPYSCTMARLFKSISKSVHILPRFYFQNGWILMNPTLKLFLWVGHNLNSGFLFFAFKLTVAKKTEKITFFGYYVWLTNPCIRSLNRVSNLEAKWEKWDEIMKTISMKTRHHLDKIAKGHQF